MSRRFRLVYLILLPSSGLFLAWLAGAAGESSLRWSPGQIAFTAPAVSGALHRIEVSEDLRQWRAVQTLRAANSKVEFIDAVYSAPGSRYYRAVAETDPEAITGDHLQTDAGDVVIHPVNHASFVLRWDGKTLYNDPVGGAARYAGLPQADLVLVSHQYGDHWDSATLDAVRKPGAVIVVPPDVFNNRLSLAQRANAVALANGQEAELLGLDVAAVPAYNDRHPQGRDNGYVLTIGNRRIYMSGDTGPTPEMLALEDIDAAFLCMNIPFTMSVDQAAEAVRTFEPSIVYPYHYRNQDGSFANLNRFRDLVETTGRVAVRMRTWY